MSNITTDLESFENIDYPKNIFELLLKLKNEPLQINCNSSNSNTSGSYNKYNSEETLLRVDDVFGGIYTKTFRAIGVYDTYESALLSNPINFSLYEEIQDLNILSIIDFSCKLTDKKLMSDMNHYINFYCLNQLVQITDKEIYYNIPVIYDTLDDTIMNKDIHLMRTLDLFVTLVYTKNVPL